MILAKPYRTVCYLPGGVGETVLDHDDINDLARSLQASLKMGAPHVAVYFNGVKHEQLTRVLNDAARRANFGGF